MVIGGILSSTLLTLLVLPSVYGALLARDERKHEPPLAAPEA